MRINRPRIHQHRDRDGLRRVGGPRTLEDMEMLRRALGVVSAEEVMAREVKMVQEPRADSGWDRAIKRGLVPPAVARATDSRTDTAEINRAGAILVRALAALDEPDLTELEVKQAGKAVMSSFRTLKRLGYERQAAAVIAAAWSC